MMSPSDRLAECPNCGERATIFPSGPHMRFVQHQDQEGQDCDGWFRQVGWDGDSRSEGRFTVPRADCPHPERWHSKDADSTEMEVTFLVGGFVRALQPDLVVETGSAWGQTSQEIGIALQLSKQGVLHTIEPDPVRADHTRQRCEGLPVVVEQMKSLDWTPPGPIGFAWFDSLADLRVQEFRRYRQWLPVGAVVGFHDTGPHQGGLREMVEALEDEGLLVMHLPTPRGVSFGQVIS
jgi:hypothetical protein